MIQRTILVVAAVFLAVFFGNLGNVQAAKRCVTLIQKAGGQVLVNGCNSCRTVKIERKRPSSPAPVYRTYTLPKKSSNDLPLRGRGRTRIVSDQACERPGSSDTSKAERSGHCIVMTRKRSGQTVMLNQCDTCQSAVLERTRPDGSHTREVITVLGKSFIPVDPKGALQARIVVQKACR